jgi:ABC-type glycerol-3-phosphate transport system substrate-binding protein
MAAASKAFGRRECLTGLGSLALSGCRSEGSSQVLRVWAHRGQEAEHRALLAIAHAFNRSQKSAPSRVELSFFPDFQYTEKLAIAAAASDMPAAFELDGPLVARFVDAGLLAPLDPFVGQADRADFLPTILKQGTIAGNLYALGAFESAAVLYFDRELFEHAGIEPPQPTSAYEWSELLDVCERLKRSGIAPLALHMNESADEWYTYAFSPVVWSGGGRLIGADGASVRGVLASRENVRSLTEWQLLFRRGYAQADPVDPDPFGGGRVAMDWSGHWMLRSHLTRKANRLGVMQLPRCGDVAAAPCGSWCWGISPHGEQQRLAAEWVRWVTSTEHGVVPLVRANAAVPARRSAFAAFPEYERFPHRLLRHQLERAAHPRPRTPFYATLTQHFAGALRDIARGADVAERLGLAEQQVARVIERRLGRTATEQG